MSLSFSSSFPSPPLHSKSLTLFPSPPNLLLPARAPAPPPPPPPPTTTTTIGDYYYYSSPRSPPFPLPRGGRQSAGRAPGREEVDGRGSSSSFPRRGRRLASSPARSPASAVGANPQVVLACSG